MDCDKCCESIDGLPGNGACQQCLDETRMADLVELVKSYDRMMTALLNAIYTGTEGNYK